MRKASLLMHEELQSLIVKTQSVMKMICKSKETHTKMKKSPDSGTTGTKMMVNQKYQVLTKFLSTQNVPPYKL
jgi:hypothetical protein